METAIVTCLFNPTDSDKLKKNFKRTLKNLSEARAPIYVVELIYPGQKGSALSGAGANQLASHTVLHSYEMIWQKEALLNIAIEQAKHNGFKAVAWLDGDVLYSDASWYRKICEALNEHDVIQCFKTANIIQDKTFFKFNSAIAVPPKLEEHTYSHTGLAWAARLSAIPNGLFCCIPTGDELMWAAFTAHQDSYNFRACSERMNLQLQENYAAWKESLNVTSVGFIDAEVLAQPHGSFAGRDYRRELDYYCRNFNPAYVQRHPAGYLEWSRSCPQVFQDHVDRYFQNRND